MNYQNIYEILNIGYKSELTGEFILKYDEVIRAIDFVVKNKCAIILGGDILDTNDHYLYDNWYYEPNKSLSRSQNILNSGNKAICYLKKTNSAKTLHYIIVLGE